MKQNILFILVGGRTIRTIPKERFPLFLEVRQRELEAFRKAGGLTEEEIQDILRYEVLKEEILDLPPLVD